MKNKFTWFALAMMIVVCLAILSGCNIGMDTYDDIVEKFDIVAQINYYSNGGFFNEDPDVHNRSLYYKENQPPLEITDTTSGVSIEHTTMVYAGWYTISTKTVDGVDCFVCDVEEAVANNYQIDGQAVVKKNGDEYIITIADYQTLVAKTQEPLVVLDEEFDFANTTLQEGDEFYLAVLWVPNQTVDYVLITEGCSSISVSNGDGTYTQYNNGQIVDNKLFDKNNVYEVSDDYKKSPLKASDATFVDYYVYEENATVDSLTLLTNKTIERPEDGSNVKIYVKYVYGDWNVVRVASDVSSLFSSPNKDYYISRDIDCSTLSAIKPSTVTFSGTICGNGHTISNLNFQPASTLANGAKFAMFGTMSEKASITNVTFENVTLTCAVRPNASVNVYVVAHTLTGTGLPTLDGVKLSGVTLEMTLNENSAVANIPAVADSYDTTNWLCTLSNADFMQEYAQKVTIENAQLVINQTVVDQIV